MPIRFAVRTDDVADGAPAGDHGDRIGKANVLVELPREPDVELLASSARQTRQRRESPLVDSAIEASPVARKREERTIVNPR